MKSKIFSLSVLLTFHFSAADLVFHPNISQIYGKISNIKKKLTKIWSISIKRLERMNSFVTRLDNKVKLETEVAPTGQVDTRFTLRHLFCFWRVKTQLYFSCFIGQQCRVVTAATSHWNTSCCWAAWWWTAKLASAQRSPCHNLPGDCVSIPNRKRPPPAVWGQFVPHLWRLCHAFFWSTNPKCK